MAYDVYHRGCRRRDDVADWRAMLKFQFVATGSRFEPSWNHDEADDAAFSGPAALPPHLIQHRIEIGQIHGDVFRPVVRHAALAGLEHRLRTFTRLSG